MKHLNFNPYAFIAPQNATEFDQLLDEALMLADTLALQVSEMDRRLEAQDTAHA